jgi:NADH:ubiquinone oxidoreductase subunit 5 (subunit L)/multisubunit Na+/H+ antiporter MnhA subunit
VSFSPEVLIVLGPLIAAAFAGLLQRYIGDKIAMAVTTASVGLSLALSLPIFADFVSSFTSIRSATWPKTRTRRGSSRTCRSSPSRCSRW